MRRLLSEGGEEQYRRKETACEKSHGESMIKELRGVTTECTRLKVELQGK